MRAFSIPDSEPMIPVSGAISQVAVAVSAFAATNLDDILVLLLFFSQINQQFHTRHIWIGQYLGFSVLVLASLPGFLGGFFVPRPWLGLLGLLPIAIGLSQLFSKEDATPQAISPVVGALKPRFFLAPQIYQVAAVTIANGGDNIGIYVPLFANSTLSGLGVTLIVFFLMVAVWCALAQFLSRQRAIERLLQYSDRIIPFVLIGLGIYILSESETYRLFISKSISHLL